MPQLCCQCCQSSPRQARPWVDNRPFFPLHHFFLGSWTAAQCYDRDAQDMTASQEDRIKIKINQIKKKKKSKGNTGRGLCRHPIPSPCARRAASIAQDQGAGRSGQVSPRTVPSDTFDNLVTALVPSQTRGCCRATVGPSALSHLAGRFELAEGSLSTTVRAAPGHGQAAHAHCNFAIILLLPSPPRPSDPPPPPLLLRPPAL